MMRRTLSVGALVGFLPAANTPVNSQTNFGEVDGVIVIEAELFSNNISRVISGTNFQWIATNAVAGFSGSGYLEAKPNNGVNMSTSWLTTSPELDYAVTFSNALRLDPRLRGEQHRRLGQCRIECHHQHRQRHYLEPIQRLAMDNHPHRCLRDAHLDGRHRRPGHVQPVDA
jgi:hypothetical protein